MVQKKNNIQLYLKLTNFFIKKGKLNFSKNLIVWVLLKIFQKTKLSPYKSIIFLFFSLNSFIEIRQILRKRRKHFVPFSLTLNRRIFFCLKWLKLSIQNDNRKISLKEKLSSEVLTIFLNNKKSKSLNLKKTINDNKIFLYRSNVHFRW
jgi:ribosomal protein S7